MSAPFNGTKTRVVGFLKGLFGKSSPASSEALHDDGVYDYNNAAPVTGAQLSSPAPAMPAVRSTASSKPAATVAPQRNGNGHNSGAATPAAQRVARQNGNTNGFSISAQVAGGHVNGVVVAPKVIAKQPPAVVTHPAPIPEPAKSSNGSNGNGVHAQIASGPAVPAGLSSGQFINLPLAALVAALPLELQARVLKKNLGNLTAAVSLDVVLSQLPTGVVKVPFATIREAAPHCFTPNADADQLMVTVPLGEVLRQVNPVQLAKPSNQVRITADDDITSPFADKGNNAKLEVKGTAPARSITPSPAISTPPQPGLDEVRNSSAPTPRFTVPTPSAAPKPSVPASPAKPAIPTAPNAPIPMSKAQTPAPSPAPAAPKPAPAQNAPIAMPKVQTSTPSPASSPAPTAPPTPKINGVASLRLVSAPSEPVASPNAAPAPASAPAACHKPTTTHASLTVALQSLVDTWPDAVKQELHEQNLLSGSVDLPLEDVASQLKNGRVAFTWQMIRGWLTPSPGVESAQGSVEVELPLKVIAPAFLGLKSGNGAKAQRLTADDHIPNVFAQVATTVPTAPIPTPAAPLVAPAPAPEPAAMTPEAVVKRAAALKGVAGVLVALPDGLVVASKLPAGLSADSLAAFLPQIYAKFDACLKDLSMDGLNNLNFTAGNVPWRVFRTSSVFFAAFGRANEPIPGDWLATLAGELEKK